MQGARVDWFTSPLIEGKTRNRRLIQEDAISGMIVRLTWTEADDDGIMLTSDNKNDTGGITRYRLLKVQSRPFLVFLAKQEDNKTDDALMLLSYYPNLKKLIWSSHLSKFLVFEGGAHGKLYMADCQGS